MKKYFPYILSIALSLTAILLVVAFQAGWVQANPSRQERVGAPTMVSYQGQIWDGDKPFNSTGYFKFAIYDSSEQMTWSNDGNDPPTIAVPLEVVNGLFSVNLGDSKDYGMEPLTLKAFEDPDTFLQVWFSPDGTTWTMMPEQRIAAVPYALQAHIAGYSEESGESYNASHLDNHLSSYFQKRVSGYCEDWWAVHSINADGSVVCWPIPFDAQFMQNIIGNLWSLNTSMAIGVDGYPLISYYDGDNGDLVVTHCIDNYCVYHDDHVFEMGSHIAGNYPSIAIGKDGMGLISFYDETQGDLIVAHCEDISCSLATINAIDPTGTTGLNTSITIGEDGLGLISYYDLTNLDLRVAHCNNTACTSATTSMLDSTGDVGRNTSITLGTDGLGLISYYDNTNGKLKTAHCNNTACTTASYAALDSYGLVSSIVIGTDGLGLISFYDAVNDDLKVAHCSNIACSSAKVFTLDSGGNVGNYADIAIGADGLGLISYWDYTNDDLKVAHCINVHCSMAYTYTLDSYGGSKTAVAIGADGMGIIAYYEEYVGMKVMHCGNNFCNPDYQEWRP